MKKKIKSTAETMLSAAWESTKFCFKYAPLRYTVYVACEIIFAVLPFAVLYNWQNIINTLTAEGLCDKVWFMGGFYIAVLIFQLVLGTFNSFLDKMSYETIDNNIQSLKIKKLSSLEVGKFYDPKFQDEMSVVGNSPGYPYVFNDVIKFIKSAVIAVIAICGVAGAYPAASALIVLFYIPTVIINSKNAVTEYKLYRSEENEQRKSSYYRDVLTGRGYAAELRLYGFEDLFRGRYNTIWQSLFHAHMRLKKKQTAWEVFGQILNTLGFVALLAFLLSDIKNGVIAAGNAALYIGIAMTLMSSVQDTCNSFSTFHMNYLQCAGKFKAFLNLTSALDESGIKIISDTPEIEFRDVSFKYPGGEDNVLKNISFKLQKGEKLALVGINGAGKTTLIKLLCRFYDPTEGEILFDGIPAREYNINSLRGLYGVLFQNSITYTMSLRDNIMLSDIGHCDNSRFEQACMMSGVGSVAEKLKDEYKTEIGRLFNGDNYEPSGGERQKIGLARAYYKDTSIMSLDEPSSALDAEAEDHIFRELSEVCRDKSAVLISHRLSAVSMADKVALLENGELFEFGGHEELIKANGRYAELYKMQAEAYGKAVKNE
ncbi:MAG: ABC transporter ATP-binding protein [Eubacteriales bacterium]